METYLLYGILLFCGFTVSWLLGSLFQKIAQGRRLREWQTRSQEDGLRLEKLSGELHTARLELGTLKQDLETERQAHNELVFRSKEHLLKRSLMSGLAGSFAGLLLGALLAGVVVDARAQVRLLEKTTSLEVLARTSEARTEILRSELSELREETRMFRRNVMEIQEGRAVAVAKLEMLLDFMSGRRGKGDFDLDLKAIRDSLGKRPGEEVLLDAMALGTSKI